MSVRSQALQAPQSATRHEWQLVLGGFLSLLLVFVTLVVLATANAPTKGGTVPPGTKVVSHQDAGVRVGGDGPYQYHPLP